MDENQKDGTLIVDGYEFMTEEDAENARTDLNKIKLLKSHIRENHPNEAKAVYEKAILNKIFKTPIGWDYLHNLRTLLLQMGFSDDELIPIPLGISVTRHQAYDDLSVKQRVKPESADKADFKKVFPIVLDIVLFILVIIMFIITAFGETDNIINYKRNTTNRYASWEEDLTKREKAVRQKERELGITVDSEYYEGD